MLSNVLAETRDRSAYILLKSKSRKSCRKLRLFFCAPLRHILTGGSPRKERNAVKEEKKEEPRPNTWEAVDPKPPVIRSGHLENRIRN